MYLEKMSINFRERHLANELASMIELGHSNIIQLLEMFRSNRIIFIFMENCHNGSLADQLIKNGKFDEISANNWFKQMAQGLTYSMITFLFAIEISSWKTSYLQKTILSKFPTGFAKKAWIERESRVIISDTFCGTEP